MFKASLVSTQFTRVSVALSLCNRSGPSSCLRENSVYIQARLRAASVHQETYCWWLIQMGIPTCILALGLLALAFHVLILNAVPVSRSPVQLLALKSPCSSLIQEAEFAGVGCSNQAPADTHPVHFVLCLLFPHTHCSQKKKSPWSSQKHPTGRFAQFPSALPCISNLNLQHQRQQRKDEDGSYPSYSLCPWFICFVASWGRVHNFSPPPPTRTPLYHQSSCY